MSVAPVKGDRVVKIRPHHFLCSLGFQGKGYSPDFVANFWRIVQLLEHPNGEKEQMKVVSDADDICMVCPKRRENVCSEENSIRRLDRKHAAVLGVQTGDILTWGEAKKLLKERMSLSRFHFVCANCSWKNLGHCEDALLRLQASTES